VLEPHEVSLMRLLRAAGEIGAELALGPEE